MEHQERTLRDLPSVNLTKSFQNQCFENHIVCKNTIFYSTEYRLTVSYQKPHCSSNKWLSPGTRYHTCDPYNLNIPFAYRERIIHRSRITYGDGGGWLSNVIRKRKTEDKGIGQNVCLRVYTMIPQYLTVLPYHRLVVDASRRFLTLFLASPSFSITFLLDRQSRARDRRHGRL